jgi:hypothetical protein
LLLAACVLVAGIVGAQVRGDWRGRGVVLALLPPPSSLHAERPVIIIEHEPIAGLMDERMSMPFIAASTDLFRGIAVGDRVRFALAETPDALLVVSLERVR